ncbi:MAG: DivIVA [Moorella sp. 60_41]|nr:MAG: DivIVA [Moorella sp. 60_41]
MPGTLHFCAGWGRGVSGRDIFGGVRVVVLTPLDINKKEFRRSLRGYSCEEVDEFLAQLLKDYTQVFRENQELRERILYLEAELERFNRLENTLKETLVMAQKAAEEARENARQEAEALLKQAEARAQSMIAQARNKAAEIERYQASLEARVRSFKARWRSFLLAQLELLEGEEQAAPAGEGLDEAGEGSSEGGGPAGGEQAFGEQGI